MFISRQDTADETIIILENSLTVTAGNKQTNKKRTRHHRAVRQYQWSYIHVTEVLE